MLRPRAQSMIAVIKAPDWDTNARSPDSGGLWEKLALTPMRGSIRPRQFGPWMRNRLGRAASSIRLLRPLLTPAAMTTAARVPLDASCSISGGTVSGGVARTPRSGAAGSAAIEG